MGRPKREGWMDDHEDGGQEGHSPGGFIVGPIEATKASDALADRIRRSILDGRLEEGTVLQTERGLMEQTGLGRSTVREALRLLQAEGLVVTRPGRGGGTVVRRPKLSDVVQSLEVFIRGRQLRFQSLMEIREALEPTSAALAATRRTDADLARLTMFDGRMNEPGLPTPDYFEANTAWHLAIAQASHNELLVAFMEAIGNAIEDALFAVQTDSEEVRPRVLHAHGKILEAIRTRDAAAAERRMSKHLHAYQEQVSRMDHPEELPLDEGWQKP